jgi:hypothetical protein
MRRKKIYSKPDIREVDLVPKEAVLQACKQTGTGSATRNNDGSCKNIAWSCQAAGS